MVDTNQDKLKVELLATWLENSLSPDQRLAFENFCKEDKSFAAQVEQANYMTMLSETSENLEPPKWDKSTSFTAVETSPWWKWDGLPACAFALSLVAIIMVSTGFNVSVIEGRFSIGFTSPTASINEQLIDQTITTKVELLVQSKFDDYQASNQQLFAQYINSLQEQQLQTNKQFTEFLLASSRQERREDFAELIKFVNQQRYDDQVFYARQLNELQQEINQQAGYKIDSVVPVSEIKLDE